MKQGKRKPEVQQAGVSKVLRKEDAQHPQGGTFIEVDGKSCFHRVAWPKDAPAIEEPPPIHTGPFAKDYPFELDPFQNTSIACLEAGDSVLVSAHTSAGKTVIAQYACAMAIRDKTRMIYTSPLKALSNQKYRELYDDFQDVGLLTGDVTINEDASCLVVTTEVFRSMLYESNSIVHEVKSVVFDEVHYLRDKERGVVWEECLILMPPQTQAIFLSATVPNAFEFATWFATVHGSKCHIVYTENRPVPLQHYIFPAGADGIYLAIDEKGRFQEENFQQACSEITGASITVQLKKKENKFALDDSSDIFKLMKMVLQRFYDPVIVFAFSKRTCEQLALQLAKMDINNDEEKQVVEQILKNAIDGLSDRDRRLPQVQHILPMLKRGIGVHHSGLLPIVKEAVELLFQEGLIKILFATETFSTGLNMPAKTVVFAGAKKFDDGGFRWIYSGEYIQMSGRAGRRGIDDKGIVILIADKSLDVATAREILKGAPCPLTSEFRIGYRMILDNLKREGGDPEGVIRKSYKQFLCQASAPKLRQQLEACLESLEELKMDQVDQRVTQFVEAQADKEKLQAVVREKITLPKHCLPFLNPGRLVTVVKGVNAAAVLESSSLCWGLVVNFTKKEGSDVEGSKEGLQFVVDVLVNAKKTDRGGFEWMSVDDESGTPHVIGFSLNQLSTMSTVRVHLPKNLKSVAGRVSALKCLKEVIRRLTLERGNVPLLDPIKDMKIPSGKLKKTLKQLKSLEKDLEACDVTAIPDLHARLAKHQHRKDLMNEKKSLEEELEAAQDMILKHDLRHMLKLLIRLDFIDETGLLLQKGQIARQFRTADELLLTEMVFNGQLSNLTPHQIASVVSCVVKPDSNQAETKVESVGLESFSLELQQVSSELSEVFDCVVKTANEIGKLAVECKVVKHLNDYAHQFKPHFMEAIFAWSNGASFTEIIKLSDLYEGSVVRIIRQVHRVLLELESAVKQTGQQELEEKIRSAQELIKKDVVFAASLYL